MVIVVTENFQFITSKNINTRINDKGVKGDCPLSNKVRLVNAIYCVHARDNLLKISLTCIDTSSFPYFTLRPKIVNWNNY